MSWLSLWPSVRVADRGLRRLCFLPCRDCGPDVCGSSNLRAKIVRGGGWRSYNQDMSSTVAGVVAPAKLRRSGTLPVFAGGVVGFMVLVILEGAFVRATGSGAGCGNHWPLCNGDFFPHHPRLATVIEYTHRSMTGFCTTLVAVLIGWTFWARPRGDRARRAVVWCGVLLITEALLGAVLVKGGYVESNASNMRVMMQCVHFTNTMLLLAAITVSWWWLRGAVRFEGVSGDTRMVAWVALAATIVVGATGSVAALADTLFPSTSLQAAFLRDFAASSPLLVRMRWVHPASAAVGLACAIWLALRLRNKAGRLLLMLISAQLLLGVVDVLLLAPTWMQIVHLLGADIYWIALVAICVTILAPGQGAESAPGY
jgi:cytochrome c oxidase assembly protein subunit 15